MRGRSRAVATRGRGFGGAAADPLLDALVAAALYGYVPAVGRLWQERDGSRTTPAAADGDPVGEIAEYTGEGPSGLAPSDDARGVLRVRGGLRWVEVTRGTTEYLIDGDTVLVDGESAVSYFAALRPTDYVPIRQFVLAKNSNLGPWGGFGLTEGQLYAEIPATYGASPFTAQHLAGLDYLDEIHNGGGVYSGRMSGVTATPAGGSAERVAGTGANPTRLFRRDYAGNLDHYGGRFYGLAARSAAVYAAPGDGVRAQMGLLAGLYLDYPAFATTDLPTLYADWDPTTDAYQNAGGTVPVAADGDPCLSLKTGSLLLVASGTAARRTSDSGVPSKSCVNTAEDIWTATAVNFDRRDWSVHMAMTLPVVARGVSPPPAGYALFGAGSGVYGQISAAGTVSVTAGGTTATGTVPLPPGRIVLGLVSTSSGMQVRANGALLETVPLPLTAGTLANLQLFGSSDLSNPMLSVTVNRVVVTSPAPAAADVAKLEEYLRRTYPPADVDYTKAAVVLHGNSLVSAGTFASSLTTELGAGYAVVNRGLAGQSTPMMAVSGPADADPYFDATRYDGQCVVGWEITNDLRLNGPSTATLLANYRAYREAREAVWGQSRVVLLDCLPATDLTGGNGKEAKRVAANADLAAEYDVATADPLVWTRAGGGYLVTVSEIPELADPTDTDYYTDGLHLTTASYDLIAPPLAVAVGLAAT